MGVFVYCLASLELLPTTALTKYALMVGKAAGRLLLSWGLADRMNTHAAVGHVEAMRSGFEQLRVPYAHNPVGVVTANFGLVLVVSPAASPMPGALYRAADELLYEAKHAGRNELRSRVI